jgi:hypothetical protein
VDARSARASPREGIRKEKIVLRCLSHPPARGGRLGATAGRPQRCWVCLGSTHAVLCDALSCRKVACTLQLCRVLTTAGDAPSCVAPGAANAAHPPPAAAAPTKDRPAASLCTPPPVSQRREARQGVPGLEVCRPQRATGGMGAREGPPCTAVTPNARQGRSSRTARVCRACVRFATVPPRLY